MKKCKKCEQSKHESEFNTNKKTDDNLTQNCKACIESMPSFKKNSNNTKKYKASFIGALEKSGNISWSCKQVGAEGISRQTYYKWTNDDDTFKKECDDIREGTIDLAESVLLGEIKRRNLTATIFYLKTVGRNRGYVERQEMDVDGDLSLQVQFIE